MYIYKRQTETHTQCVFVFILREFVCVSVSERQRESIYVCVYLRERDTQSMYICVCLYETKRDIHTQCVCIYDTKRVCVYIYENISAYNAISL